MKRFIAYAFISVAAWISPYAFATGDHASHAAAQTVAQAAPLSEGEVRKIDKAAGNSPSSTVPWIISACLL